MTTDMAIVRGAAHVLLRIVDGHDRNHEPNDPQFETTMGALNIDLAGAELDSLGAGRYEVMAASVVLLEILTAEYADRYPAVPDARHTLIEALHDIADRDIA